MKIVTSCLSRLSSTPKSERPFDLATMSERLAEPLINRLEKNPATLAFKVPPRVLVVTFSDYVTRLFSLPRVRSWLFQIDVVVVNSLSHLYLPLRRIFSFLVTAVDVSQIS